MFALCSNCGNTSADYEKCDSCKKTLPEQDKMKWIPKNNNSGRTKCHLNKGIAKAVFYSKKIVEQAAAIEDVHFDPSKASRRYIRTGKLGERNTNNSGRTARMGGGVSGRGRKAKSYVHKEPG